MEVERNVFRTPEEIRERRNVGYVLVVGKIHCQKTLCHSVVGVVCGFLRHGSHAVIPQTTSIHLGRIIQVIGGIIIITHAIMIPILQKYKFAITIQQLPVG